MRSIQKKRSRAFMMSAIFIALAVTMTHHVHGFNANTITNSITRTRTSILREQRSCSVSAAALSKGYGYCGMGAGKRGISLKMAVGELGDNDKGLSSGRRRFANLVSIAYYHCY